MSDIAEWHRRALDSMQLAVAAVKPDQTSDADSQTRLLARLGREATGA